MGGLLVPLIFYAYLCTGNRGEKGHLKYNM